MTYFVSLYLLIPLIHFTHLPTHLLQGNQQYVLCIYKIFFKVRSHGVFLVLILLSIMPFPGGSDGKESTCTVGNLVRSLGWEDPLEKGMATHSSILAWRIPMDKKPWQTTVHGVAKRWTQLSN